MFWLTLRAFHEIIDTMRRLAIATCMITACFGMVISSPVLAQELAQPSDTTVVDNLRTRCDDIQSSLRRLHTSDALLRVNVGQTYNTLSARLMARLNSRLALNRIDSRELVDISGKFDQLRGDFASDYNTYESSFSALLKIDCKQKPVEFYAKLLSTRDARLKLAETVKQMNGSISDYRVAAEKVKAGLSGAGE